MSVGETIYSARVTVPQVLERGRAQTVSLEVYRDGALVAPAPGTYTLVTSTGSTVIDAAAVTISSDIATYSIPAASLPSTLDYGEGYAERWELVMPDSTTRTYVREASIAKFQLSPPVSDVDILEGDYPDLVEQLGTYGTSLQGFTDSAWRDLVNRIYSIGEWPDVIVSRAALRAPLKELICSKVFRFLWRRAPNSDTLRDLWQHHLGAYEAAWSSMSYRVDRDQDGTQDGTDRISAGGIIYRGGAPQRRLTRSTRW